MNTVFL